VAPAEARLDDTRRFVVLLGWSTVVLSLPIIAFGFYPWYLITVDWPGQGLDPAPLFSEFGLSVAQFVAGGWWILGSGVLFLVASLGLARLREWARLLFLVLIGATIVLNLFGLMGLMVVDAMMQDFAAEMGDAAFADSASLIVASGYFLTLITVVLFGWLMWRLTRDDVVRLFQTDATRNRS
jgi:amino acid transporter